MRKKRVVKGTLLCSVEGALKVKTTIHKCW